jgi:hypothetical protein
MKTTDIKTYSNQLQEKLTVKIESIAIENMEIISRSSKCLLAVNEILGELKRLISLRRSNPYS